MTMTMTNKWPHGRVPYTVDPKFTLDDRAIINKAIQEYTEKTCIRFVPKTSKDDDYVAFLLDNDVCGVAHVCRMGGWQYAKMGRECMKVRTVIHELGHSICMKHEHSRVDRDKFIKTTKHTGKDHNFQIVESGSTTSGLMYDYQSVMHYGCRSFFKAKSGSVTHCGGREELSVLDAEKINAFYDCGCCHSYRFRSPDRADNDLVTPGYDTDGSQLGVCRAYVDGVIVPGKYDPLDGKCYIPWRLKEQIVTKNFEVLTLPQPKYFSWEAVKNGQVPSSAVAGGRSKDGALLYIGRCLETLATGKTVLLPGYIRNGKISVPHDGKERNCINFEVLTCSEK